MLRTSFLVLALSAALAAADGDGHGEEDPGAERARIGAVEGVRPGMVPFVLPWNDGAPGPTDLGFLNHRPAGRHGWIRAAEDGTFAAGGEPIRFLGVNLIFGAAAPAKEEATAIAARMAKFGINLVRFHHIDNHRCLLTGEDESRSFDAENLDRFDFLVAELRRHGIYSNFNLLVSRRFKPGDGIGPEVARVKGKMQHLLGFFHDGAFALHAEYARELLGHRNPYTGLRYADDPAVAFVEIVNENGLANTLLSPRRSAFAGDLAGQPERYVAPLRERWNAFVAGRHGDLAGARAAWGLPADHELLADGAVGFVPVPSLAAFRELPLRLRVDWLTFLRAVERDYYRRMGALIREEIGSRALIAGSTLHSGWPNVMAEMDFVDGHVYWENPRWRGGTWNWMGLDWHILNRSHVDAGPGGRLRWIAMGQIAGKPYTVSEFNHAAPNVFAGEAPLYLAAHGALQGWDACYLFPYASDRDWDSRFLVGNKIHQHPTKMANMTIAALMLRRGDVRPAERATRAWMGPEREVAIAAEHGSSWNIANGFKIGLDGDDVLRHRVEMVVGPEPDPRPEPAAYEDAPAITSDTGEVTWDGSDPRGAALVVDAVRTKSVFGMICERRFELGDVVVIPGATMDGGGCVSLSLLDGDAFADAGRALLVATARAENAGMLWKTVRRETHPGEVHHELDSWGRAPTAIEPMPARIVVPGDPDRVTVHVLDEGGQRSGDTVPVVADGPGRAAFAIGAAPTLWFEVVWRRD